MIKSIRGKCQLVESAGQNPKVKKYNFVAAFSNHAGRLKEASQFTHTEKQNIDQGSLTTAF